VETLTTTSPDGRSWTIDAFKEPYSFEGLSFGYVIGTLLVLGLMIFLALVSWYVAIGLAVLLVIWLCERISNHARPRLRARTEGPPPEELAWKTTSLAHRKVEERVARAIAAGNVDLEPPGLRLLSHQSH